jgi:acetylornithine deacetylase/succinyl-diaminopimelate desuccinylase-like protein
MLEPSMAAHLIAITRMTVSPNVIRGGVKTNIVPDSCEAEVDIRVMPGQNKAYVLRELKPILGDTEIKTIQYHAPTVSPADSPAYDLIKDTMTEYLGKAPVLPGICAGATDSRYLRLIGVPSYGIGMLTLKIDASMKGSVHGMNEKLDVDSLRLKSEFLVRLAEKYLA